MGIAKWESFLENHIEGFFNRKFSSQMEDVELFSAMKKNAVENSTVDEGKSLYPNSFRLMLCDEDYQRFCPERFIESLHVAMKREIILMDALMDGNLKIHLQKVNDIDKGRVRIDSACILESSDDIVPETTITVGDRREILDYMDKSTAAIAALRVVEGNDVGTDLRIGEQPVSIGRLEKNAFILNDPNVSRVQALISYERHRHVLYDEQSLNGTFVNGKSATRVYLCSGDEIVIGNTTLLYEVI